MTMRHIVSWKLSGETLAERDEQAAHASSLLLAMQDTIEQIQQISVHRNEEHDGVNHDLVAIIDVADAQALGEYAQHPNHQPAVDFLRANTVGRTAIDYTI